jgi:hypothetical protein
MLRGFIDQPTLKALPLYSRLVDAVKALSVPKNATAKAAQAWSDKGAKAWTTMKPLPSSEHPQGQRLLFDLGTHASTYAPE